MLKWRENLFRECFRSEGSSKGCLELWRQEMCAAGFLVSLWLPYNYNDNPISILYVLSLFFIRLALLSLWSFWEAVVVVVVESFLHLSVLFTLKGHSKKQRAFWVFFLSFIHFLVGERESERVKKCWRLGALPSVFVQALAAMLCSESFRSSFLSFFLFLLGFIIMK